MKELEHAEQCALMQWWQLACHSFGIPRECLFAIPNGGVRHIAVAKKLKAEGVLSGVPDLFLAYPSANYHGLFIEMKKAVGGRTSNNQIGVMRMLIGNGYYAAVCHGWVAAKQCIEQYLKG